MPEEDCGCPKVVQGAVGLTKVAMQVVGLSVDSAPIFTRLERRQICIGCPEATHGGNSVLSQCKECGCFIAAKTRLASEFCPLEKWPAVTAP